MSNIEMEIHFPLDDERCFRRECPFCGREFKVQVKEDELNSFVQLAIKRHLLEGTESEDEEEEPEYHCPYCAQSSAASTWWTQEQIKYLEIYLRNLAADAINKHLIEPLNRQYGHGKHVRFSGKKMGMETPWISPETSDMRAVPLPCCNRVVKVIDDWSGDTHCFFCGFPHRSSV